MRFLYTFLLPALLGFLVSCSSGKQHVTTSAAWGAYPASIAKTTTLEAQHQSAPITPPELEGPVFASSESNEPILASARKQFFTSETAVLTETQPYPTFTAPTNPTTTVLAPPPGADKTYRFGLYSLISGILAFAPFVLGLSLLYAIPFALLGIFFGYKVVGKRKGYRQRGVALAKAGLLMSGIIAIVLILLGAMAVAGG